MMAETATRTQRTTAPPGPMCRSPPARSGRTGRQESHVGGQQSDESLCRQHLCSVDRFRRNTRQRDRGFPFDERRPHLVAQRRCISTAINAGSHNQGVNIQTGPNGEVYVTWAVYDAWPSPGNCPGFRKVDRRRRHMAARSTGHHKHQGDPEPGNRRRFAWWKDMRTAIVPVDDVSTCKTGDIYIVWTNIGVPGSEYWNGTRRLYGEVD